MSCVASRPVYRWPLWLLLTVLATAVPVGDAANAQIFGWPWDSWGGGRPPGAREYRTRPYVRRAPQPRDTRRSHREREDRDDGAVADARDSSGPLLAIVSLYDQRIFIYDDEGLVARSVVSTGQRGYRTPTGIFSVIQKNRHHESNIYSGAPMPWMHRITWSGIALHGGVVPRYPASHGCIRLTYSFAPRLWAMSKIGMRVIVAPDEVVPHDFAHARLPVPVMTPIPVASAEDSTRSAELKSSAKLAVQPVTLTDKSAEVPIASQNPYERARALRVKAIADAAAAEKAAKPAMALARQTALSAKAASVAVRRAAAALEVAERRLAALENPSAKTVSDTTDEPSKGEVAAQQAVEAARAALADAKADETKKDDEAFAASAAARQALSAKDEAAEMLNTSLWGLQPISVFISRAEGRIYLRQAFNPIFEAPITIREPGRPLGTHLFTAMASQDGGAKLRWSVVTVPDGGFASDPAEALDRIDIPKDIEAEIGERLWPGASIIVSDHGISHETGRGTDFVVLTKD